MRIVRFRGETSVGAIADRAYADLSSTSRKKAVAALIRANPQLATLKSVRSGAVLTIPDIPGVRPAPGRGPESPSEELGDLLIKALQDYQNRLTKRHEAHQSELKEQEKILGEKSVREAVRASRPALELMERVADSIAAEAKAAQESQKRLEAAIEKLTSELASR